MIKQNSREKFLNSPYADLTLYIEHPIFERLADLLDQKLQQDLKPGTHLATAQQASIAVTSIVANLLRANWAGEGIVAISLNRNNYSPDNHLEIGYAGLRRAINFLTSSHSFGAELIEPLVHLNIGFQTACGFRANSKLELNPQALESWINASISNSELTEVDINRFVSTGDIIYKSMIYNSQYNDYNNKNTTPITNTQKPRFLYRKRMSPICLKAEEGDRAIEFDRTPETDRMAAHVTQYNDFLSQHTISLFLSDSAVGRLLEETKGRMVRKDRGRFFVSAISEIKGWQKSRVHRVFNRGSFNFGGRHYGGFWQNIPKQYRSFITINGHPTVELDYGSLHPTMIYHQRGLEPQGDPYLIKGLSVEYRGATKLAFLVLVNAPQSARRLESLDRLELPDGWNVPRLIQSIKTKHQHVSDAFKSDLGICLQRLDSDMAAFVIREMRIRHGALALPMHDSFIVTEDQAGNLEAIMREAYKNVIGDHEIRIDRKRGLFDCIEDPCKLGKPAELLRRVERMLSENDNRLAPEQILGQLPIASEYQSYLSSFPQVQRMTSSEAMPAQSSEAVSSELV